MLESFQPWLQEGHLCALFPFLCFSALLHRTSEAWLLMASWNMKTRTLRRPLREPSIAHADCLCCRLMILFTRACLLGMNCLQAQCIFLLMHQDALASLCSEDLQQFSSQCLKFTLFLCCFCAEFMLTSLKKNASVSASLLSTNSRPHCRLREEGVEHPFFSLSTLFLWEAFQLRVWRRPITAQHRNVGWCRNPNWCSFVKYSWMKQMIQRGQRYFAQAARSKENVAYKDPS